MQPSNNEINDLRKTSERLSDPIVRIKAHEEKASNEFSVMISELLAFQNKCVKMNKELREARNASEHTNEDESMLLALISHEIRTPISGIMGMTELLESEDLSESQREKVNVIKNSAGLLLNMINDLLDLSEINAGKMELRFEPVRLKAVVEYIFKLLEVQVKDNGNILASHIDEGIDDNLIGDTGRITQIILNLLTNANKFTSHGHISLRIILLEDLPDSQYLRFEMKDTGIGISPEDQSKLFQPYIQTAEGSSLQYGGTGLGLFICKLFVELMQGRIGVVSEPGKGSSFWFELKLRKGDRNMISAEDSEAADYPGELEELEEPHNKASYHVSLPVLVVEDQPISRQVIIMLLRKLGIQHIDSVGNGEEAVQAVTEKNYALIFMDHMMPKISGLEAAKRIRELEREMQCGHARIIALTGLDGEYIREQCLNAGMDDYILKPVSLQSLSELLQKWLPAVTEHTVLDEEVIHEIQELNEDDESDLLSVLFQMYTEDTPGKLQDLRQHLLNNESESVSALAHKLKSSSLSLGIVHFSNLLSRIEQSANEGRMDICQDTMELLFPAYEEACDALETYIIRGRNES
ncbi:ATP-binding protein [Paenibacillus dakarensis]|uniref:ATP-binding protein n=1 Tax=Paenibacillus dakarensis TaxID=1527293 RepID=UPI0006D5A774|nr:ATP-binding protein [Paenibacillus dakarensis]